MRQGITQIVYWCVFTLLAIRLIAFVDQYAVDLFFYDQWSYLTTSLYPGDIIDGFLTRLGPHRLGLGYFFYKPVLMLSDYNNRAICFMVASLAIINALIFTWLKIKHTGRLHFLDIHIPLIFFSLVQYAIFVNNTNISIHQLSITMVLVVVALLSSSFTKWKCLLLLILIPLMAFTGNGFFVVMALLGFSLLMLFRRQAHSGWWVGVLVTAAISIGAYLATAFYGAMDCQDQNPENVIYFVKFFKGMLLNGLVISYQNNLISWLLFIGLMALAVLVLFRIFRNERSIKEMAPLLIIGYVLLFMIASILGRWCYPLSITESSRYIPHMALGFLAFTLFHSQDFNWKRTVYSLFLTAIFSYAAYKYYRWHQPYVAEMTKAKLKWKECYQTYGTAGSCNEKLDFRPYPGDIERIKLQEKLERLEELNPSYRKN